MCVTNLLSFRKKTEPLPYIQFYYHSAVSEHAVFTVM